MGRTLKVLAVCSLLEIIAAMTAAPSGTPAPRIISVKGNTLVPLRYISEWLGARVDFDPGAGIITLTFRDKVAQLRLGDRAATVNGEPVILAAPATERSGVTYVPLRFVGEALGAVVEWDPQERAVTVYHPYTWERLRLSARGEAMGLAAPPGSETATSAAKPRPSTGSRGVVPQDGLWSGRGSGDITGISFIVDKHASVLRGVEVSGSYAAGWEVGNATTTYGGETSLTGDDFAVGSVTGRFTSTTTAKGRASITIEHTDIQPYYRPPGSTFPYDPWQGFPGLSSGHTHTMEGEWTAERVGPVPPPEPPPTAGVTPQDGKPNPENR
jgi:hypothetical protein